MKRKSALRRLRHLFDRRRCGTVIPAYHHPVIKQSNPCRHNKFHIGECSWYREKIVYLPPYEGLNT